MLASPVPLWLNQTIPLTLGGHLGPISENRSEAHAFRLKSMIRSDKHESRTSDVGMSMGRLFPRGVGTRRLTRIVQEPFGRAVSATTVSKTTAYLDEEVSQYQSRLVSDDALLLFLERVTHSLNTRVRQNGRNHLSVMSTGASIRSTKEHVRQASTQSMATSTPGSFTKSRANVVDSL